MHLELAQLQTAALIRELSLIIDGDRYPLSPRVVALKEILGQLRPEPERAPAPLPRDGITSRRARGDMDGARRAIVTIGVWTTVIEGEGPQRVSWKPMVDCYCRLGFVFISCLCR
jgi:hypothetical protein